MYTRIATPSDHDSILHLKYFSPLFLDVFSPAAQGLIHALLKQLMNTNAGTSAGPVVKTLLFQYKGCEFDPWSGN